MWWYVPSLQVPRYYPYHPDLTIAVYKATNVISISYGVNEADYTIK